MISRYKYRGGEWIDLEHPTADEVRAIAKEFSISERLETELFSFTPTPLVASDAGATFLALHFPTHSANEGVMSDQEIDFVVGDSFIITVRYEVVEPLHRLRKLLETQKLISSNDGITTDILLEILFAHLYTSVRDNIDIATDHLARIEREMFSGHERNTVRAISNVSREFLHIEASIANQEGPLSRFLNALSLRGFFGASFAERIERMHEEHAQVARLVKTYRAVATELRETNASLLEARQNEIMQTLTVITFGVMPLELIALIFGMHSLGTPLEQNPNAFWIILAIMFAVGGIMMAFFARKRWLA
ncbi:MAG: magnesium transporter CorA family protein [Candidatus Paceibacteria bacterium]